MDKPQIVGDSSLPFLPALGLEGGSQMLKSSQLSALKEGYRVTLKGEPWAYGDLRDSPGPPDSQPIPTSTFSPGLIISAQPGDK